MTKNHWHYQLMRHPAAKNNRMPMADYYAIHEYYPMEDGDGWTEQPVPVDGDSAEDVKNVLMMMLEDIQKHGVKDYDYDQKNPRDD